MVAQQSSSSSTSSEATDRLVGTLLVVYIVLPTIVLLLGVAVLYSFLRKRRRQRIESNGSKDIGSGPLLDVWAERQRRGIGPAQSAAERSKGEQGPGDKPFGSKYYYAHNNANSTGGYKDGLRMEDYTMNGPRLLARNGVALSDKDNCAPVSDFSSPFRESTDEGVQSTKRAKRRIVPVSHYLWDDPGKGTGTIRVDQLPHPTKPGEKRSWKDSGIASVRACLVSDGSGIEVVMESEPSDEAGGGVGVEYRLVIPKLYGPVASISTVTKPTRLLVKLEKRTTLLDRSNAKPWPHPQKKLL